MASEDMVSEDMVSEDDELRIKFPVEYRNGAYQVRLDWDGEKVRTLVGDPVTDPPTHPESIDLKITNWCDAGCPFCHESSTTRGQHADARFVMELVEGMKAGTELAIGGGNPLAHPQLEAILEHATAHGVVCNMTINSRHLSSAVLDRITRLQGRAEESHGTTLYGVGLSIDPLREKSVADIGLVAANDWSSNSPVDNLVLHVIAGVVDVETVLRELRPGSDLLILGYKTFGLGQRFEQKNSEEIRERIRRWRYWLGAVLGKWERERRAVCFDNLAIEQLGVRRWIGEEEWGKRYMGDDGEFTMYVDAVRMEFARSSTGRRMDIRGMNVEEMFRRVRGES